MVERDLAIPQSDGNEKQPLETSVGFPVVGIGASAGGLDAFKKFFQKMPPDSGAAFVLVPHLDPNHESLMAELIAHQTHMPVREVQEEMPLEPNCVYVIAPNKYLTLEDGSLKLFSPTAQQRCTTAIDFFFRTLAAACQERAIGIVLSGTSSHGALGIKDIKLAGGMVMAQEPKSAEYNQMPLNAIATGLVDFVLPPEQMPDALVRYLRHPYVQGPLKPSTEVAVREHLNRILAVLKARTKYDFRSYRKNMLTRRVLRRMGLLHIEQMSDYLEHLRENPEEVTALYKDLLIGVTEFFRDPEAFQVLQQRVIPELISRVCPPAVLAEGEAETHPERRNVRVWVPGCSTGEEAFSIAMLLFEQFAAQKQPASIHVFATDIDERSLETARLGIYPESSLTGISPERLQRFFTKIDSLHWQVNRQLRELITIAQQNLISDAPFSKLDLICCRNLLIYLEPEMQVKVIRLFHFSLVDGGYLLLGPSESIGRESGLFETISKKWRIFRRIGAPRGAVDIPIVATEQRRSLRTTAPPATPTPAIGFRELLQRLILDDFAPASVLINRNHEIVSVFGPLVNYLEFPPGEITKDLLALARTGLRTRIRSTVLKALQSGAAVTDLDAKVKRDGLFYSCSITVKPIAEPKDAAGLLLVTFRDHPSDSQPALNAAKNQPAADGEAQVIQQLEQELKSTREDLQSTVEEYESSTEELKVSNEEIMSMNEELQSANEELETSKEELQSLNEELTTVNSQLQEKVEELDRVNNDLTNLINSSDLATLFLDVELRIKRFTPPLAKLLNLRSTDTDRPVTDLAPKFTNDSLPDDCRLVLEKLSPSEREVWTKTDNLASAENPTQERSEKLPKDSFLAGVHAELGALSARCYLRRIVPYRTSENRIEGVVITFVDITERIKADSQSRRLATVLWDSNDAITVQGFDGRILAWNRGAERMYGYSESEALKLNIRETIPEDKRSEAFACMQSILREETVKPFETQRCTKDGRRLDVELTLTAFRDELGATIGIATTERDISQQRDLLNKLQHLNTTLENQVIDRVREVKLLAEAISHLAEGVMITGNDLDWPGPSILFVNDSLCQMTGFTKSELIGNSPRILQGELTSAQSLEHIKKELGENRACTVELVNYRKDGTLYDVELFITPLFDAEGKRTNFVSIQRDVSERRRAENALQEETKRRESQYRLTRILADSGTAEVAIPAVLKIICDGFSWQLGEMWQHEASTDALGCVFTYQDASGQPPELEGASCQKTQAEGANLALRLWETGQSVWVDDIRQDPNFGPDCTAATAGLRTAFAFPATANGTVLGAFVFFTALARAPDNALLEQMDSFGKQVGDFIHRKRSEKSLHDSEEKLRAVLETANDAIITIDRRGIIQSANTAAQLMFQYSTDELIGNNVGILMPKSYRDEHASYLTQCMESGEARLIGIGREVTGIRKDGSMFAIDLAVSEVDHMGLFTGILRDISRRKELEKQVLAISAQEQRRIGQELHDVTGQELTGLTLVAGTLALMLKEKPHKYDESEPGFLLSETELQQLRQMAERLTNGLTEANQHVQQLSHGIMPVQVEPSGLRAALQELCFISNLSPKLSCTCEIPESIEVANNTTATQLYRIAQEAVNNALRHSFADQLHISLHQENGLTILEVTDNGIGIKSSRDKAKDSKRRPDGFGLGIMSYRASMIGGELHVGPREPTGTCVRCVVRREPGIAPSADEPAA